MSSQLKILYPDEEGICPKCGATIPEDIADKSNVMVAYTFRDPVTGEDVSELRCLKCLWEDEDS